MRAASQCCEKAKQEEEKKNPLQYYITQSLTTTRGPKHINCFPLCLQLWPSQLLTHFWLRPCWNWWRSETESCHWYRWHQLGMKDNKTRFYGFCKQRFPTSSCWSLWLSAYCVKEAHNSEILSGNLRIRSCKQISPWNMTSYLLIWAKKMPKSKCLWLGNQKKRLQGLLEVLGPQFIHSYGFKKGV